MSKNADDNMPQPIQQLIANLNQVISEHEKKLYELTSDAETVLLKAVLAAEKRVAARLRELLPEFQQGRIGDEKTFRILNTSENIDVVARIYSILQSELQPFSDQATQWATEYLSQAFIDGTQSMIDVWNVGSEEELSFTFNEQDAMIMETALTKGYGKEQRGIGKIKEITQDTADSIRDIMLRGIAERKTTTDLMSEIWEPEVGLTSLEIIDSRGIHRTLSVQHRAKLIARNEIAQIYQMAATEKARDIFDDDPYWYYGSVYEPSTMTDWCKRRFGRIARVSEWNSSSWVRQEFGDSHTGTGHIHVNCRQSGYAVAEDWFSKEDWESIYSESQHILTGKDLQEWKKDPDAQISKEQVRL